MKPKVTQTFAQQPSPAVDAFFRSRDEARRRAAKSSPRYPGDYTGLPKLVYGKTTGDLPSAGEVVWAHVPYEDDPIAGKDRPVLIIGRDGNWLLGLLLSSTNHDLDANREATLNRFWVNIGPGPWDAKGRQSFVRLDRIIRVDPKQVRRIGGHVSDLVFDTVADGLHRHGDGR
ncbi:MAG: type II toxin-antitoxin system PemK/MazF family toxin [Propionibacteriaceae bacterium]|nr:type II toxin-antitoxin system PemK/MazF family toxin [Propionibacteriaceae bacterium]